MSNIYRKLLCPICGARTKIHASHCDHQLLRRSYAQCTNPLCGATYRVITEIMALHSPSCGLFKKIPKIKGDTMDLDDQAHDLAYFFVKGSNPRWSKDETFVQTTSYLTNHLENLSEDDAQHVAARAIAEFESREYSPIWRIDIDTSSSYAIFINRYVEDKGIQKHIISLAELVEFIENRIKKEC